ncbi:alpha/beta fold hydrolase [Pelagibacterium sp. H642]|uniref:alpha/beta fold hydrolase n=1 Tax=Pelagibacterium sp. H642 TaxID=1881069 RepID=UPI0028153CBD|nr:alpha/beta fold hydrolase [Pelagibacterium sp. H642]WMT89438.1 alpha/beta hydrolase [Pelagibacterium sp. H642]
MPHSFVIVHGAWTGGWSWERVIGRLHAHGHRAFAPTLSGLCERRHLAGPAITLTTHIDDIVNEIEFKDLSDIVLVGHSYGGMVATGVVERVPDRIASVVFIEAFIPEDGMSFADSAPGEDFSPAMIDPPPTAPGEYLREEDRVWVDSKATPQPVGTFTEKLKVTGAYQRVPKKTFVVATSGVPFGETLDKFRADPGWTIRELPCGHDIAVDLPDELAELLMAAA